MFWNALFDERGFIKTDVPFLEYALWGAYGSGKTMVFLLALYQIANTYSNLNIVFIRETYSQLDDTIISDWNKMFNNVGYTHAKQKKEMHFPNGTKIKFRAFDQPEKILGGNIDIIVISQAEQIPENLFTEVFGRQRGQTTLPKMLLFTEGNPSECWAKYRYDHQDKSKLPENIFYQHFTTYDNEEFLNAHNPNFISNLLANLSASDIRRCVYGEWETHELMVFSEFREHLNVIDPFKPTNAMRGAVGGDYGYRNPATFIWGIKDYDGNVIIYDEWSMPGQQVEEIAAQSKRHGKLPVIYDFSTKRPDRDGKSVWTDLEELGVPLLESNKDELRNISATNSMMKTGRIFITRNCVTLIREIKNYHWQKVKIGGSSNPVERPKDKDNHCIDALLYLIAFLEDLTSKDPEVITENKKIIYQLTAKPKKELLNYA